MNRAEFPPTLTMLLGLVAGIAATIPAALIALLSAGGGHGGPIAVRRPCPRSFLLTRFTDGGLAEPGLVLGCLLGPAPNSSR